MTQKWLLDPVDNLKTLLAASATFQSEVGAGSAAAALGFIDEYETGRTPGGGAFAIVGSAGGRSRDKQGPGYWLNSGGELFLVFVRPTDEGDLTDPATAGRTFADVLQDIVDEMEALAGTSTYLNVVRWTENSPPMEGDVDLDPDAVAHWWQELGANYE